MLTDDVWAEWTNRDIAKHVGVSAGLVDKLRNELNSELPIIGKTPLEPALNRDNDQKLSTGNHQINEVIHRIRGTNEGQMTPKK